jgi:hypothetical protein
VSDRAVSTFDYTLDANGLADRFARGREVRKKGIQVSKSLLLEHRASFDLVEREGETALQVATRLRHDIK